MNKSMLQLTFYVPCNYLEKVKDALFDAGAGRIGNYDRCSWQTLGKGQYRPLDGSNPTIGKKGITEKIIEYKVEMVLDKKDLKNVIKQLKESHPYEEPAYFVTELYNPD